MQHWLKPWRARLTCNWFTVGLACATGGHRWRTDRVAALYLTDCGRCGKFKGWRRADLAERLSPETVAAHHADRVTADDVSPVYEDEAPGAGVNAEREAPRPLGHWQKMDDPYRGRG